MLDPAGTVSKVHIGYTDEVKANLENEVRSGLGLAPLPPVEAENVKDPKKSPAKKTKG